MTSHEQAVKILQRAQAWVTAGAGKPSLATFGYGSAEGATAAQLAIGAADKAGYFDAYGKESTLAALERAINGIQEG